MERSGELPNILFAYRKDLGTCDELLYVSQSALERGQEARIDQIDFSAAFDRVNHQGPSISSGLSVLELPCCQY